MKNVFVHTTNVKNFVDAMREGEKVSAEPVLLTFHGEAGRGKTSAARFFAAQEGWTYVRALRGWSELWMLQDLCFELRVDPVPRRKKQCFEAIKGKLWSEPKAVLIDEADKLNDNLIEWVRDLADLTFVPFALIGEKLVLRRMQKEKRVWSRTLRAIEFGAITTKDILFFARQAAEMTLSADQAEQVRAGTEGDFRLVSRVVRKLEDLSEVNQPGKITDEMVKVAVKQGLWGR
jgi:DNA transposition AAA+ family ATPase